MIIILELIFVLGLVFFGAMAGAMALGAITSTVLALIEKDKENDYRD